MVRKNWPQIRAGLIALAILVGLIDGCPLAPPGYVPAWQQGIVDIVRPVQRALLTPFLSVTQVIRFKQRWALFQVAEADRFQFQVLVQAPDGTWSLTYRAGDPDHDAYGGMLEFRRVRGAWHPTDRLPAQYFPFVRWFTQRMLDEHPEIDAVRVQFDKVVLDRGQVIGSGTFVAPFARRRGGK